MRLFHHALPIYGFSTRLSRKKQVITRKVSRFFPPRLRVLRTWRRPPGATISRSAACVTMETQEASSPLCCLDFPGGVATSYPLDYPSLHFPWSLHMPMYGIIIYIWMIYMAKCRSTMHGCHVLRDLRPKPTTSNKYTALSQASEELCTVYFNQVLEKQSQSLDSHQFKWTQKPKLSESKCLETSTQSCFHMMIFYRKDITKHVEGSKSLVFYFVVLGLRKITPSWEIMQTNQAFVFSTFDQDDNKSIHPKWSQRNVTS